MLGNSQGKHKQAEQLADLTFELLDRCQMKLERMSAKLNLTTAEFHFMRRFRNEQKLSVGELAHRMDLSSSRLTRIIDGLVKKKLVCRVLGTEDRRIMEVSLTAGGKAIQESLETTYIQTHVDILDLLPKNAGESVIFAMEKLKDAMTQWEKE